MLRVSRTSCLTEHLIFWFAWSDLSQSHHQWTPAPPASVRLPAHHHRQQWAQQQANCPISEGQTELNPLGVLIHLLLSLPVSPYLKSLSMVAANKLLHLLEAFTTPWFLFSLPHNHHLAFYLLEVFNNIIQYQFDGEEQNHGSSQKVPAVFFNPFWPSLWR